MEQELKNVPEEKKNIFLHVNACPKRGLDARKFSTYFKKNNYRIVNDPQEANYIIFFTCGFVNPLIDTCLNKIKRFQAYDAELIVAGCLPAIAEERIRKIFDGRMISTKEIEKIDELFPDNKVKFREIDDEFRIWRNYNPTGGFSYQPTALFRKIMDEVSVFGRIYHYFKDVVLVKAFGKYVWYIREIFEDTTAWIPISQGCIYQCAYCSIRKAIGPLQSKPKDQCLAEFRLNLERGCTEIGFEADDIGTYGIDIGCSLPELLDEVTNIEGEYSLQLQNIHPTWLVKYIDELCEVLKRKRIAYLLLSIQSGSNTVLQRMNRSYKIEAVTSAVKKLKTSCPDLELAAEFIIGFPGETWEEFEETLHFIEQNRFDRGSLFAFSPVEGTDAFVMEPKVSKQEMRKRIKAGLKMLRKNQYYAWYSLKWGGITFQSK